ncbi:MAG: transcription antitermination factor NusB [Salinispira sp.]
MLSRRKSRILVFQSLYSWEFNKQERETLLSFPWYEYSGSERSANLTFSRFLLNGIMTNISKIDEIITQKLEHWDFDRLGKVELSILRLGVYELLHNREIPRQVIINEAIEIANMFASPQTFRIINGVLDAVEEEKC